MFLAIRLTFITPYRLCAAYFAASKHAVWDDTCCAFSTATGAASGDGAVGSVSPENIPLIIHLARPGDGAKLYPLADRLTAEGLWCLAVKQLTKTYRPLRNALKLMGN